VLLDNRPLCDATPCTRTLRQAQYLVTIQKDGHEPAVESFIAKKGARLSLNLARLEGSLAVTSDPIGIRIALDGKPAGAAPITLDHVLASGHDVSIDDRCFQRVTKHVDLQKDETRIVTLAVIPREARLNLRAAADSTATVSGEARLDGRVLGPVPGVYTVPTCGRALLVESGAASFATQLSLKEGESTVVEARLPVQRCASARLRRTIAGWTAALGTVFGAGGMGAAYALQLSARSAPAGDQGVATKVSAGKALNVVGLIGIGVGALPFE
jgi:hypothetical protein